MDYPPKSERRQALLDDALSHAKSARDYLEADAMESSGDGGEAEKAQELVGSIELQIQQI
jgi:hypothetical protein